MSLSGNLGFVPIDEILRLLTRAKQQGSVDVSGSGFYGRIFVGKGGIDIATTSTDDELATQLVNSGVADDDTLRRVGMGETTLAAVAENNQEVIDLIREITVESLYQITEHGKDFSVREAFTSPYASPKAFELEALIHDARTRERDWARVGETIADLDRNLTLNRNVGGDEVSMKADDWRVLSQIGAGASVNQIAWNLGTTSFWTARVAARLVANELVKVEEPVVVSTSEPSYDDVDQSYEYEEVAAVDEPVATFPVESDDDYADEAAEHSFFSAVDEPAEAVEEAEVASDPFGVETDQVESSYDEVTAESEEDMSAESFATETEEEPSEDEAHEVDANRSWWQEPKDEAESTDSDDDNEDTEAFLEKVFSELDSSEEEEDSQEGHGLLRRRRMGTLRDFSSDS